MKCLFIALLVFLQWISIHTASLKIQQTKVKSLTKAKVPSLRSCVQACLRERQIKCQFLKFQKNTQQCLISESKFADLAGWLTVGQKPIGKKYIRLFGPSRTRHAVFDAKTATVIRMLAQLNKIMYLQEKCIDLQKLLSGMENLVLLKADRGLLTRKLVSMSKANRQILQLRLMGHQRQITLSSIRLIRSRSMLLGLSSNTTQPGATYQEDRFNRLISMLRLNQGRLARDILLHLLKTLQVFQGLQNYDRYLRDLPAPQTSRMTAATVCRDFPTFCSFFRKNILQ